MYFLNYLDRNALPQARLNSLEEDLNLTGVQYNTAISILFVGYILMQSMSPRLHRMLRRSKDNMADRNAPVPSNMFMTRTRPSIYLSCCMIGWATVSTSTAAVTNHSGLVACRFFLGFVEAVRESMTMLRVLANFRCSLSIQVPCTFFRYTILARNLPPEFPSYILARW